MGPSFWFALLAIAASVSAASLRSSQRTPPTASTATASWSKRTAVAPDQDSDPLPFVTSRVERVPRPEKAYKKTSFRGPSNTPSYLIPSENSIDHGIEVPLPSKRKSKQQGGNRRWISGGGSGTGSYDPFGNGGRTPPSNIYYRHTPVKHYAATDLYNHRSPSFDPTASVRSPTISVTPLRYKIIDMGDPWAKWHSSTGTGYDPHGRRPHEGERYGSYRPDGTSYRISPLHGYRQQQQFGADASAAYSDLEGSVIDPFRQYAAGDALPWSVQVGTSLTVKDDGRESRRRFYVRSQANSGYDDFRG